MAKLTFPKPEIRSKLTEEETIQLQELLTAVAEYAGNKRHWALRRRAWEFRSKFWPTIYADEINNAFDWLTGGKWKAEK